MSQAYTQLLEGVRHVRSAWRWRRSLEGLLLTLALSAALLWLGCMLDQGLDFNRWGRSLALLACVLMLLSGLWRWVMQPLRTRHADDFFAALVEQREPGMNNRLINALQLGRDPQVRTPGLVHAIVEQGATAVEAVNPASVVREPAMQKHAILLAVVLGLSLLYFVWFGQAALTSLWRVLLPGAAIAPFTYTQLTMSPVGEVRLLEGSPLAIEASVSGLIPSQDSRGAVTLHWKEADGSPRAMRMTASTTLAGQNQTQRFSHEFAAVSGAMTLQVRAGDARSEPLRVFVDARPRLEKMSATYQYPAYTTLPDHAPDPFDGHLIGLPGTQVTLTCTANQPLAELRLVIDGQPAVAMQPTPDSQQSKLSWTTTLTLQQAGSYRLEGRDERGHTLDTRQIFSITLEKDAAPLVQFTRPGRDVQVRPADTAQFALVAQDDFGIAAVTLLGRLNDNVENLTLHHWPLTEPAQRRADLSLSKLISELGLKAGDRLQYWASAEDRLPAAQGGPNRSESRRFNLIVLTEDQAQALLDRQLSDYAKLIAELAKLQRQNHAETSAGQAGAGLVDRQLLIRRQTQQIASVMERNAFPMRSVVSELRSLAGDPMSRVIGWLESYRDEGQLDRAQSFAQQSLPVQLQIAEALEDILKRLDRNEDVRQALRKMQKADPPAHQQVVTTLEKLAEDLQRFLGDMRTIEEKYEKMPKDRTGDLTSEELKDLAEVDFRIDRWKKWKEDTVLGLGKLATGFVEDAQLRDNLNTIFEEVEKKQRPPTEEVATPIEENAPYTDPDKPQEVLEDLETWLPDKGDSAKWVLEDPMQGTQDVPPWTLPETLQDMVGDLIEDLDEFDEEADDVTNAYGVNPAQSGWLVMDGGFSSFAALGKTGNQLPNASDQTGRSGSGRRGQSSGQSVGTESAGLEGRPTPARVTNEAYDVGQLDAKKQLDPRGSTGGGKKTGGGQRGLQGGTPPDLVEHMQRLAAQQKLLRERAMQISRALDQSGRSSLSVNRAIDLLESSEQDLRDQRYDDAARKRKTALGELKAVESGVDEAVNLSLQRAVDLPAEMRQQISSGVQQAMPEGYEELVGAYYRALSDGQTEKK